MVERPPGNPALRADGPPLRVDVHPLHGGEVDDDAPVAGRITGEVVAAATHSHEQLVLAGKVYRRYDVRDASAADDQRRALVDHRVPHPMGYLVVRIAGTEHGPRTCALKALIVASSRSLPVVVLRWSTMLRLLNHRPHAYASR